MKKKKKKKGEVIKSALPVPPVRDALCWLLHGVVNIEEEEEEEEEEYGESLV